MRNDTKNQKPFRPLVYICPPFSGDVEGNTERTRQFETAKRRRQPVRYFNADFEEVDAL